MFTQLPTELVMVAKAKMEAYEREAARERMLKAAWQPSPLRKALARMLCALAERLAVPGAPPSRAPRPGSCDA